MLCICYAQKKPGVKTGLFYAVFRAEREGFEPSVAVVPLRPDCIGMP